MEFLKDLIDMWVAFGKENPAIAGSLTLAIPVMLGWTARSLPAAMWRGIMTQVSTTLTLDNSGYGDANEDQFDRFMDWHLKHGIVWLSRNYYLNKHATLGVGDGIHFFFFKRRLFWFYKSRLDSTGIAMEKREISIHGLTRDGRLINELCKQFEEPKSPRTLGMYRWGAHKGAYGRSEGGEWVYAGRVNKRELDTVAINQDTLKEITDGIDYFLANKEFYNTRGISYKHFIVLYGPPGTGKTALGKALSSHHSRDIYIIDLKDTDNQDLPKAFASVPPGSMILMEDFDAAEATWSREYLVERNKGLRDGALASYTSVGQGASLNVILNCTDGIVEYDNILMFGTTNHLERIDPAFYRDGRADLVIEIPKLRHEEIVSYLVKTYGEKYADEIDSYVSYSEPFRFADVAGSKLQTIFKKHKDDPVAALDALEKYKPGSDLWTKFMAWAETLQVQSEKEQ